ncbi:hypothetical protein FEM48_Zijuj07G0011400 [Ziziphus jujuba var. spinosa]|uniref:Uncharacterized protein n=1 Tax=Ziziphus jujuba var. spinosa TaxID=714518 RepID=A0A978V1K0_ZIZJJ|nr:hypothetical protein FEM48_Zijuj07G0011400 [Ziziphus jujuba var. spinosa]
MVISLDNCTTLQFSDIGDNNLSGNIPTWIDESLTNLVVLGLKSNKFNGSMPLSLCNLSSLQILDLSKNRISGLIPSCIQNFTSMAQKGPNETVVSDFAYYDGSNHGRCYKKKYADSSWIVWKGMECRYEKNSRQLK